MANGSRKIIPEDILLPGGFKVEAFAEGLTTPINLTFTDKGEILYADAGITSGNGKVYKLVNKKPVLLADGFHPPLTGITFYQGDIYVAHRGYITKLAADGSKTDIVTGLPSWGDHHNNRVVFGMDEKMYFGQGTATNSGVVGLDNDWVKQYPYFHDYPGAPIILRGQNFGTSNILSPSGNDIAYTGAYSPFGVPGYQGEQVKGHVRASGSILRANPDGSHLELVAWGLRNPFRIKFDRHNRLFAANHGADVRGSRPIANSPDEFRLIQYGMWYGWPDYTGGRPVTLPEFKPPGHPQPAFLLAYHPMTPPHPIANFEPHSATMGFDFNYHPAFGKLGDVFIAEFGSESPETTGGIMVPPRVGHRVSRIDINTGQIFPFAINAGGYAASYTGGGGLERPIDAVFGPEGDLFIVDFGMTAKGAQEDAYLPETGLIWRIFRM